VWNDSSSSTSAQGQARPQRTMQETSTPSSSKPRAERRISVRLPLKVKGRDSRGINFEEETSSENLCRGGAAFLTRFDVAIGSDLEICIPQSQFGARRKEKEADFATQGRVVHIRDAETGERLVGVQFTGPRFRRLFQPETAA
jgi:PilZ domain